MAWANWGINGRVGGSPSQSLPELYSPSFDPRGDAVLLGRCPTPPEVVCMVRM